MVVVGRGRGREHDLGGEHYLLGQQRLLPVGGTVLQRERLVHLLAEEALGRGSLHNDGAYRGLKFTCMRTRSQVGFPMSLAGENRTRGITDVTLAFAFAGVSGGSRIDFMSTRPVESTTNCIHVVMGWTRPMMPRMGIDSDPPSVTPLTIGVVFALPAADRVGIGSVRTAAGRARS